MASRCLSRPGSRLPERAPDCWLRPSSRRPPPGLRGYGAETGTSRLGHRLRGDVGEGEGGVCRGDACSGGAGQQTAISVYQHDSHALRGALYKVSMKY